MAMGRLVLIQLILVNACVCIHNTAVLYMQFCDRARSPSVVLHTLVVVLRPNCGTAPTTWGKIKEKSAQKRKAYTCLSAYVAQHSNSPRIWTEPYRRDSVRSDSVCLYIVFRRSHLPVVPTPRTFWLSCMFLSRFVHGIKPRLHCLVSFPCLSLYIYIYIFFFSYFQ